MNISRYGSDQFVLMGPHEFMSSLFENKKDDDFDQFIKDTNFPNFNLKFGLYENIPHDKSIISSCDMMSDDINSLTEKLSAIKSNGYEIELDDFGSGYTSMNILSSLPIDVVKLDMSFMKQFGDKKREKVLVACINLAKELGYKTVSEGVEMKEQKDTLAIWGVDYIQGYYYSKPLPEE